MPASAPPDPNYVDQIRAWRERADPLREALDAAAVTPGALREALDVASGRRRAAEG